jgi:hypothetical protein
MVVHLFQVDNSHVSQGVLVLLVDIKSGLVSFFGRFQLVFVELIITILLELERFSSFSNTENVLLEVIDLFLSENLGVSFSLNDSSEVFNRLIEL